MPNNLPFQAGETVEVIIVAESDQSDSSPFPLKGTVLRYDDPFEPAVSADEWEALQ